MGTDAVDAIPAPGAVIGKLDGLGGRMRCEDLQIGCDYGLVAVDLDARHGRNMRQAPLMAA